MHLSSASSKEAPQQLSENSKLFLCKVVLTTIPWHELGSYRGSKLDHFTFFHFVISAIASRLANEPLLSLSVR